MPHFLNIFLIQCIYYIQGKNVEFVLKIATNVLTGIPAVIRQKKIISDDSWHIPGFLSTLSNCWTHKSLLAERLSGYSRVCFSQASWISTRDGSAFNFPRDPTLLAIWGFPSGLKQGKVLMSYEHQLLAPKKETWKTEKNTFLSEQKKKSI